MKTFLKRLGIVIAILVLFLVIAIPAFYGIENWRGKRAWEKCKAELEAKGEKLDAKDFIPPPVSDAQNFAASPLFQPLFDYTRKSGNIVYRDPKAVAHLKSISAWDKKVDSKYPSFGNWMEGKSVDLAAWQTYYQKSKDFPHPTQPQDAAHDVLFALAQYDPEIAILQQTANRRYSRYPLHYEDGLGMMDPHILLLMKLNYILSLRASAHLALNKTDEALNDVKLQLRLASSLGDNDLISYLVKTALCRNALQPIWDGLANHQWSPSQLAELSKQIQQFDFFKDFQQAVRGERALFNRDMEAWKTSAGRESFKQQWEILWGNSSWKEFGQTILGDKHFFQKIAIAPKGWFDQAEAFGDRYDQDFTLQAVDVSKRRIHKDLLQIGIEKFQNVLESRYGFILKPGTSLVDQTSRVQAAARAQTYRDLALTAIALEQYRLANHDLPATLAALSPQFLKKIPNDVMNGKPLKYRRESNDRYALYSVGWNETDDGGKLGFEKDSPKRIDFNHGDWVWPMPAKK